MTILCFISSFTSPMAHANPVQRQFLGSPVPGSDGFVWQLPADRPIFSECGVGDLDWDGIADWVESELAWVFRPYVVYDENAEHEVTVHHLILYQATPVWLKNGEITLPTNLSTQPVQMYLKIWFLFRKDNCGGGDWTHWGDNPSIKLKIESIDPPHHTQWRVVWVKFRKEKKPGAGLDWQKGDIMYDHIWSFYEEGLYPSTGWPNIEWHDSSTDPGRVGDGMKHFAVYLSLGKHGYYPTSEICHDTYHGCAGWEACNGGWEGLPVYGVTSAGYFGGGDLGFEAQEVHAEYQSLTPHQRAYLGNVGEFRSIGNWIGDGQKEPDPAYCFITTDEASDYWKDKGSVGRLSTGSIGLAHESVRWGVWGEWDYKFDYEYMWDNYHGCFCGGEGHGDTVPGVPGCDEACGDESTATCADEMDTKVVKTVGPDMNRCLFGHDTDQDGYPDGLDCDPLNPYLRLDTDGDGWCDMSAESSWAWPVPGSGAQLDLESECLQTCNLIYGRMTDTPTANTYLVRCTKNCTLPEPDNCIDLTYEACAAVIQGIESARIKNTSFIADRAHCRSSFANGIDQASQPDQNSNGIGDKCESTPRAAQFRAESVPPVISGATSAGGLPDVMSWCVCPTQPKIQIDFDAEGGQAQQYTPRPTTLGACRCENESAAINSDCRENYCPDGANPERSGPVFAFTWDPIQGCNHMGENQLQSRLGDEIHLYEPQQNRCRYKDVEFRLPARRHYAIDWLWTDHKDFTPPDLLTSLSYDPTTPLDVADHAVRLRLAYVDPETNTAPSHVGWYPQSTDQYSVCDDLEEANIPYESDLEACSCAPVWFRWERPPIRIIPEMYYRNDRLKDPGAWAIVRDPVSHELGVLTLQTGRLVPSTFQKTTTFSGQPLSMENAAISSARIDTTQYGLSHPDEKVLFSYGPAGQSGASYEPPSLHMALVERQEITWLSWQDLFGEDTLTPDVSKPKLAFHYSGNELLLIGQTTDASGITHENSVLALSLETGRAELRRPMTWLGDLSGYSIAADQTNGRLILAGNELSSGSVAAPSAPGLDVWLYDMASGGYFRVAMPENSPPPRLRPGVAMGPDGTHAYIYGGTDLSGAALSDAWKINVYTGETTLIAQSTAAAAPAGKEPFVLYDRRRQRLWAAAQGEAGTEPEVSLWSIDEHTGQAQRHVASRKPDLPAGRLTGQLRDGKPAVLPYTVPTATAYGRILSARLISSEPQLKLRVEDARGKMINTSNGEAPTGSSPEVVWPAVPEETYRLVVAPAPGFAYAETVSFEIEVETAAMSFGGEYTTSWKIRDMEIRDQTAFLACRQGLEAVDISEPASAQRLTRKRFGRKGRAVEALGPYLIYGRGPGMWNLRVIDAADPTDMTLFGQAFGVSMTRDIALEKTRAYTAQGLFGVDVYSLDQPHTPRWLHTISVGGAALSVAVGGRYLYVARLDRKVSVFRIEQGLAQHVSDIQASHRPVRVTVHGDKLVVGEVGFLDAFRCFAGIRCRPLASAEVFDVSDPAAPALLNELSATAAEAFFDEYEGARRVRRGQHTIEVWESEEVSP